MVVRKTIDVHLTWCYRAALTYWITGVLLWFHTQRQTCSTHATPEVMFVCSFTHKHIHSAVHCSHGSLVCVSVFGSRQFCAWRECATCPLCSLNGARVDTERVVETSRRRVLVEVQLENRGENAYNTQLQISHSANLYFSSLMVKVCFYMHIQSTMWHFGLSNWVGSSMKTWHFDTSN